MLTYAGEQQAAARGGGVAARGGEAARAHYAQVLTLLALLVQKYTY